MIARQYIGGWNENLKIYAWHSAVGHPDSIAWSNTEFYGCGLNKNVYLKYNQAGTKTKHYDYDAYGNVLLNAPVEDGDFTDNDFLYSSEYTDSWGLVHYLYRTYSPARKRFIQEDPIEEQGGINLYCFVGNSPVTRFDSTGLWTDNGNDIYSAGSGDTLSGLAIKVGGSSLDYQCLWPVNMKTPDKYPNIQAGDCFDASNLTATDGADLQWRLDSVIGAKSTYAHVSTTRLMDMLALASGEGAEPIKDLMLFGHANSTVIGGTLNNITSYFSMSTYNSYNNSIQTTGRAAYDRVKKKKGTKRCWFTKNASVWFAGCNSSGLAQSFANGALRKGAQAHGTRYYTGWGGMTMYTMRLNLIAIICGIQQDMPKRPKSVMTSLVMQYGQLTLEVYNAKAIKIISI